MITQRLQDWDNFPDFEVSFSILVIHYVAIQMHYDLSISYKKSAYNLNKYFQKTTCGLTAMRLFDWLNSKALRQTWICKISEVIYLTK